MNPKYVTSLPLSQRLQKLGVKQESEFAIDNNGVIGKMEYAIDENDSFGENGFYSAFLSGELGEMLPTDIDGKCISVDRFQGKWLVGYTDIYEDDRNYQDTEAEARGKLLAYLKKNKII